jgi:uncharacterized sporulation protein YeaH/YhbH (DUF444 family)
MSLKIDADLQRFKDIIKNKVKHNLGKFISSEHLIGQQGNKKVKIPLSSIDIPHFVYGSRGMGGTGMGRGDIGDPIGGPGQPGQGDSAGEEEGDHSYETEFTPDELAQFIIDQLNLPKLEPKSKGSVSSEKNKYNRVNNVGNEGLKHFKRTYKEALKRQIATGTYNPDDPVVIPIKGDFRYKSFSTQEKPEVNAVVIYMMDVSGSMGDEQKFIVELEVFWIDLLLRKQYKDIESIYLIHDSGAREVSRSDFFKVSTSGGTHISSAYDLCAKIMEERYPFSEYNVYPFHFSDGDNYSQHDNADCARILSEKIFPNCNAFSYGQVKSNAGSGEFINFLKENFQDNDKLQLSQIESRADILESIKTFFEKGK